jgi:hypothetical protein
MFWFDTRIGIWDSISVTKWKCNIENFILIIHIQLSSDTLLTLLLCLQVNIEYKITFSGGHEFEEYSVWC